MNDTVRETLPSPRVPLCSVCHRAVSLPVLHLDILKVRRVRCLSNFSGSNTDGSSTMAVSNSFLSPLKKAADLR